MLLELSFRSRIFKSLIYEKSIDISLRLVTIERATKEILKCDPWDIANLPTEKAIAAILFTGYLISCREAGTKPKYNYETAVTWAGYMKKSTAEKYGEALSHISGLPYMRTELGLTEESDINTHVQGMGPMTWDDIKSIVFNSLDWTQENWERCESYGEIFKEMQSRGKASVLPPEIFTPFNN